VDCRWRRGALTLAPATGVSGKTEAGSRTEGPGVAGPRGEVGVEDISSI
jgi:hypothetical protein